MCYILSYVMTPEVDSHFITLHATSSKKRLRSIRRKFLFLVIAYDNVAVLNVIRQRKRTYKTMWYHDATVLPQRDHFNWEQ